MNKEMVRVYVGHSSSFDFKGELYDVLKNSLLSDSFAFVFPHEHSSEPVQTQKILPSCSFMLAEASYPSTGLGIELGFAFDLGVPIIFLVRKGSSVSSSLKVVSDIFVFYEGKADLCDALSSVLREQGLL
ncbi:hypothetical protein H6501_05780 [Candidatus Woesearchaeota archaeon]|nr:hypothetical protein [Candidatus Woesearchaeota archaeon]